MKKNNVILILLIVNLIFSSYLFSKLNKIMISIKNIKDDTQSLMYKIHETKNSVYYLKKYNNWISEIDVDYDGFVNGNKTVKFSWQIKDATSNSDVTFYYRRLGEDDYNVLPVSFSDEKYFSLLEINTEGLGPDWSLFYKDKKEPHGFNYEKISPYTYEYYIEFKENDTHLISELEQRNLSEFVQTYSTIDLHINIVRDKIKDINFDLSEGKVSPKGIILEKYYGNKVIEENIKIENKNIYWESQNKLFDKFSSLTVITNNNPEAQAFAMSSRIILFLKIA